MAYEIVLTNDFTKSFKKLYKKHPSLRNDLLNLIQILQDNPDSGTKLGHNLHKIRLAITSKGKGKSGGARVITFAITKKERLYLISIYDKSDIESLSKKQILQILKNAGLT